MAVNPDVIASLKGDITICWGRETQRELVERNQLPTTRSNTDLGLDADFLASQEPEIRAAIIAKALYGEAEGEFNTEAHVLAAVSARLISTYHRHDASEAIPDIPPVQLSYADRSAAPKVWLVDYFAGSKAATRDLQEVAWLRFAFDFGATPGDLLAWGVSEFAVLQLIWWQRRDGESILQQHIRALRNGWAVRYLSAAVRSEYQALLTMIDAGNRAPEWFLNRYEAEIAQLRELRDFFDVDTARLAPSRAGEWAQAFLAAGLTKATPDAIGKLGWYLSASFKNEQLNLPFEYVARYLEGIGETPESWAQFDEVAFFGRAS